MSCRCSGAQLHNAGRRAGSLASSAAGHARSFNSSSTLARAPRARNRTGSTRWRASLGAQIDTSATSLRQDMFAWLLNGPGRKLRQPLKGRTNYLGAYDRRGNLTGRRNDAPRSPNAVAPPRSITDDEDALDIDFEQESHARGQQEGAEGKANTGAAASELPGHLRPYPLNRQFRSQPVLSEEFREEIWNRTTQQGHDIRLVSISMGVSVERVAAVVRLKEVEKRWLQEGKPLATPYNNAVLAMLPTTPFSPDRPPVGHESINDLAVTPQTKAQLFHPVAESRAYTREDAGNAFEEGLRPADERIPHPELVLAERDRLSGMSQDKQADRAAERLRLQSEERLKALERRRLRQQRGTKVVKAGRWDFMFREINAEAVGADGRSDTAVGWRYGAPHQDRKKGQIKIPTRVL